MKPLMLWIGLSLLMCTSCIAQESTAEIQSPSPLESAGFDVYHVERSDGTTIHCYLSNSKESLPLIVNIDGSGYGSAFTKMEKGINGGMTGWLASVTQDDAHVLVIEKPGVKLFDEHQGGNVEGASRTFLENYTLEYVTQSHVEAIRAILRLPQVRDERVLIFGISDGGQIAAEVSANLPEATHVAPLACGGPTQIFDYVIFASRPQPDDKPGDVERRVNDIYATWDKIQDDPLSIEKFWSGHPYRRWSSFCSSSTTDALLKTKAEIFMAHGTLDDSVPVESFDVLVATLRTRGKKVIAKRLDGLSHHFQSETEAQEQSYESLDELIAKILEWWKSGT